MHHVQAIIAPTGVVDPFVAAQQSARCIALAGGLELIPVTDELYDDVARGGAAHPAFERLSEEMATVLADLSASGLVAYVETDYFGGRGSQAAIVWNGQQVVFGPCAHDGSGPACESPINQALEMIGATRQPPARDLFDSVGLGRHRSTDAWADAD